MFAGHQQDDEIDDYYERALNIIKFDFKLPVDLDFEKESEQIQRGSKLLHRHTLLLPLTPSSSNTSLYITSLFMPSGIRNMFY
jgi:hypothetical protein